MLYCLGEPFDKMIKQIPLVRTTCVELVDDGLHALDKKRIAALNSLGRSYNKKYTVHAPFVGINIALPAGSLLNATLKRLENSITSASALECEKWVFHPGLKTATSMFYPGMDWNQNLESVCLLVKYARKQGVKACIENVMEAFVMKNVDEFRKFYDEIGEDVGLVFDTGHANVTGQVEGFLKEFSRRIVHVHAHDNHGKSDEHLGVGDGSIDWKIVAQYLKNTSFERTVMIESIQHIEESIRRVEQLLL